MPRTIVTRAQNGLLSLPNPKVRLKATCEFYSSRKCCHGFRKPVDCCSISRLTWSDIVTKNTHDDDGLSISKKAAANRRNAQLSTGPKTEEGKSWSRRNALKHGILASAPLVKSINGTEDEAQFDGFLSSLCRDRSPVGILEEMLVEKIAVCWWRQKRALRREAVVIKGAMGSGHWETEYFEDPISVPFGEELDRILRYETTINRQLVYAINQLERLQRARKEEHVLAPPSLEEGQTA